MVTGTYAAQPDDIVRVAQQKQWTAEQLARSFHGMPIEVAQSLLDGDITIDANGTTYERNTP